MKKRLIKWMIRILLAVVFLGMEAYLVTSLFAIGDTGTYRSEITAYKAHLRIQITSENADTYLVTFTAVSEEISNLGREPDNETTSTTSYARVNKNQLWNAPVYFTKDAAGEVDTSNSGDSEAMIFEKNGRLINMHADSQDGNGSGGMYIFHKDIGMQVTVALAVLLALEIVLLVRFRRLNLKWKNKVIAMEALAIITCIMVWTGFFATRNYELSSSKNRALVNLLDSSFYMQVMQYGENGFYHPSGWMNLNSIWGEVRPASKEPQKLNSNLNKTNNTFEDNGDEDSPSYADADLINYTITFVKNGLFHKTLKFNVGSSQFTYYMDLSLNDIWYPLCSLLLLVPAPLLPILENRKAKPSTSQKFMGSYRLGEIIYRNPEFSFLSEPAEGDLWYTAESFSHGELRVEMPQAKGMEDLLFPEAFRGEVSGFLLEKDGVETGYGFAEQKRDKKGSQTVLIHHIGSAVISVRLLQKSKNGENS